MMNITPVVKQLLIINIIFFAGSYFVPAANDVLALHSIQSDRFGIWQLLTHIFMHGNIMHIAFNMFALYSFGSALEHFWGHKKFLFFYISCGLGAAALQMGINYLEYLQFVDVLSDTNLSGSTMHQIFNIPLWDSIGSPRLNGFISDANEILQRAGNAHNFSEAQTQALISGAANVQGTMVGASGAIYGLLVAFAFMFPNTELMLMFIPVPIKAKYFVPGLLCIDLVLGVGGNSLFGGGDGVAHFAHIGGALIGFIMMWYWKKNQFNQNRWN
jgi:membrane associated rhomboid family serine protease